MTNVSSKYSDSDNDPIQCSIYAFHASSNPDLCKKFIEGHQKVLSDHGLDQLIPSDDYWVSQNDVIVVLAIRDDQAIGGIRLEPKVSDRLLPFEKSLLPYDSQISQLFDQLKYDNIYEACGLWNAKAVAGNDLGILLCRVCVAIAPKLKIEAILSLNGVYTYKIPRDMGSHIIRDIGNNGLFKYPIERFHSALWMQDDLIKLSLASNICKKRVLSLRKNTNQTHFESNGKNGIKATYHIKI